MKRRVLWGARVRQMGRYFDNWSQLARFLGVSQSAMFEWFKGTTPDAATQRLILVLEHIETSAPEIHAAMVERAKQAVSTKTEPTKEEQYWSSLQDYEKRTGRVRPDEDLTKT